MCRLFKSQDPATYAAETRPMRLHGYATSVRLEAAYWDTLGRVSTGVAGGRIAAQHAPGQARVQFTRPGASG